MWYACGIHVILDVKMLKCPLFVARFSVVTAVAKDQEDDEIIHDRDKR